MTSIPTPAARQPALQEARDRVTDLMEDLDRTFTHSTHPQAVLIAAHTLAAAVEHWADLRRETPHVISCPCGCGVTSADGHKAMVTK